MGINYIQSLHKANKERGGALWIIRLYGEDGRVTLNYKDKKWKNTRERTLRRDGYICRECLRFGKTVEATTVHHVKPAAQNPELKYDSKNLYSCCANCHNTFHDRSSDELTDKGLQLVQRIYK